MRAAILKDVGRLQIEDVTEPEIKSNEVKIKIKLAGICGTDNSLFNGKGGAGFPIIPGHEAVGTVVAIGDNVKKFGLGQRVTIHPNYFCGQCRTCLKGKSNICLSKVRVGLDIDGVFAEYVVAPESAIYPVSDILSDEVAIFAEPLAVSAHAVKLAGISAGDRVLIIGAGVIGQLALQLVKQLTSEVTVCDLVDTRLSLAEKMGARKAVTAEDLASTAEGLFDVILETSGAVVALENSVFYAAPGGTIVVLGIPGHDNPVALETIVRKGLSIKGSMIYTDEIGRCLRLLEDGIVDTDPLLSGIITLDDLQNNLEKFNDPERIKTLVRVSY